MRKITQEAVSKFFGIKSYKRTNTEVFHTPWIVHMALFWNIIARYYIADGVIELVDWSHKTKTTKERLNWILEYKGLGHIYQHNYNRYYKDETGHVRPFGKWIARAF